MKNLLYFFSLIAVIVGIYQLYTQLSGSVEEPPASLPTTISESQKSGLINRYCSGETLVELRSEQLVDGVTISPSQVCRPDLPAQVAAFVKGTDAVSHQTLMKTNLALDTVVKSNDLDGDGDPDIIHIKLEVSELNGSSPDADHKIPSFDVAPGITPGLWVFSPKTRGMATKSSMTTEANDTLRAPSPAIRVEAGDIVKLTLENTHYFPHTIHLHGVDHPFVTEIDEGNDGVPFASEAATMPGDRKTYVFKPRRAGSSFYHCHVQTDKHLMMGLQGLFIVEENRPNNWLQTLNIGNGQVRHPSVAVAEQYDAEYDLHYQSMDKELGTIIQSAHDPRLIAERMNRGYDITDATEDYFLLNGHSFPMTLIDSLVTVEPDQNIKFRILNGQPSPLALHFHGHKASVTDYDGVPVSAENQVTRDVFQIAPAQRIDLALSTKQDGLHSYGEGIWLFHDHSEKAISTDGISPGGNITMMTYAKYLTDKALPKTRGMDLNIFFDPDYYAGKIPVWGSMGAQAFGQAGSVKPSIKQLLLLGVLSGLFLFLAVAWLRSFKKVKQ